MSTRHPLFLRYTSVVRGLVLGADVTFAVSDSTNVQLRAALASELVAQDPASRAAVVVHLASEVSDSRKEKLELLGRGEFQPTAPGGVAPADFDDMGRLKPGHSYPFDILPPTLQELFRNESREASELARRVVGVYRWRISQRGEHNPLYALKGEWSFDDADWHGIPWDIRLNLEVTAPARLSPPARDALEHYMAEERSEPIAHEILREADHGWRRHQRSAVALAIAAAEIGIKHAIEELVPDAGWLVMEVPSPPIVKMYRDYLPKLPTRLKIDGRVIAPPASLLEDLTVGVSLRNGLSHQGKLSASNETVSGLLNGVRDLLYLLDFYLGQQWALAQVRPETLKAMQVPRSAIGDAGLGTPALRLKID